MTIKINHKTTVALADDHKLLRNGLATLIDSFSNFTVIFQADDGSEFTKKAMTIGAPDIVLMDINMPKMDGFVTTQWVKANIPQTLVLALSMYDSENSIIRMFKSGATGYILKDCDPRELKGALVSMSANGYYYSELLSGKLIHSINKLSDDKPLSKLGFLSEKEISFLKLVCTEMTYKEIADQMFLSPRTIDGYREALFEKLNLKTRVGLVMFALKNGIAYL